MTEEFREDALAEACLARELVCGAADGESCRGAGGACQRMRGREPLPESTAWPPPVVLVSGVLGNLN